MAKKSATPKLTAAAVEATAEAFLAAFGALPGKVKQRIVELLDDYEDALDLQELEAARAANPDDFDPKNAVPWEQVKAEMGTATSPAENASQRQAA
ncbi:hypothetical protein [Hymenobacter cheonanensis]|uniref:hypothetical protein n=1 Tax=Hymenobacter sp. CA2-7 TaxID=3063993 RepID=UPI002713EE1F|nr:hypothetical protein [Hymenobacter sp. CA2-7]MDO7887540.1 hypothetical protein [Hymenobacter sp. CA2-7]